MSEYQSAEPFVPGEIEVYDDAYLRMPSNSSYKVTMKIVGIERPVPKVPENIEVLIEL